MNFGKAILILLMIIGWILWVSSAVIMVKGDYEAKRESLDYLKRAGKVSTVNESLKLCQRALDGMDELGIEDGDNANWIFKTPNYGGKAQREFIQSFIDRLEALEGISKDNASLDELPNTQYYKDFKDIQGDIRKFSYDEGSTTCHIRCIYQKAQYPFWDWWFCFGWSISLLLTIFSIISCINPDEW